MCLFYKLALESLKVMICWISYLRLMVTPTRFFLDTPFPDPPLNLSSPSSALECVCRPLCSQGPGLYSLPSHRAEHPQEPQSQCVHLHQLEEHENHRSQVRKLSSYHFSITILSTIPPHGLPHITHFVFC